MSDGARHATRDSDSSRGRGPQTVDLSRLTPEQLVRIVESAEEAVQRRHAAAAAAAAAPPRRRVRGRVRVRDAGSDAEDERDDEREEEVPADENQEGPLRAWFALARGPRRTVLVALLAVLLAVLFAPYAAAAREHAAALARFVSSGLSLQHHTTTRRGEGTQQTRVTPACSAGVAARGCRGRGRGRCARDVCGDARRARGGGRRGRALWRAHGARVRRRAVRARVWPLPPGAAVHGAPRRHRQWFWCRRRRGAARGTAQGRRKGGSSSDDDRDGG